MTYQAIGSIILVQQFLSSSNFLISRCICNSLGNQGIVFIKKLTNLYFVKLALKIKNTKTMVKQFFDQVKHLSIEKLYQFSTYYLSTNYFFQIILMIFSYESQDHRKYIRKFSNFNIIKCATRNSFVAPPTLLEIENL